MTFLLTVEDPDLFKDAEFPHSQRSLGQDFSKEAQWIPARRLNEEDWDLFNGIESHDLLQGGLGDCWLVAALAVLAECPEDVRRLFARNGHRKKGVPGDGRYVIRLFDYKIGAVREITIDEYIPYSPGTGKPCFAKPRNNKLWVLMVEKAMAKLFGSYANLEGGNCGLAFRALTGVAETSLWEREDQVWKKSDLQRDDSSYAAVDGNQETAENCTFFELICQYSSKNYMMGVSLGVLNKESSASHDRSDGLVEGHAYSILAVVVVENITLLKMRNPWGNEKEWKGAWSDNDQSWEDHPKVKQLLRPHFMADGIFWIAWNDFSTTFDKLYVCCTEHRRRPASAALLSAPSGLDLAQEQAAENTIRQLFFNQADKNGDGQLSVEELATLMNLLGMNGSNSRKLMRVADKNRDGKISIDEFLDWLFRSGADAAGTARRKALAVNKSMTRQKTTELNANPSGLIDGESSESVGLNGKSPSEHVSDDHVQDAVATPTTTSPKSLEIALALPTSMAPTKRAGSKPEDDDSKPLTREEKEAAKREIRQLFNEFDCDPKDGFLSRDELEVLMQEIGMEPEKVGKLLKVLDKDKNMKVDVKEFLDWLFSGTKGATNTLNKVRAARSPK